MDFQTLTLPDSGVTGVNADALVVVLPAAGDLPAFGGVVDEAIADAIKGGDLERKAGKSLYLPRLAGTKAGRVLLAVARDASPKAFKAAVALTKNDGDAACASWEKLAATVPGNPSIEVNRGLCAEMRGELDTAEGFYRQALQLMPKDDYASDGLRRIAARRRAATQMATHWGE